MSVFKKPEAPSLAPSRAVPIGTTRTPEPEAIPAKRDPADMRCPECTSPDVRKVSLIFESGTKATKSVAVGVSNEVGVGVIGGSQQSLLAARLQPPRQDNSVPNGMAFLAALGVFGVLLIAALKGESALAFLLGLGLAALAWGWVRGLYLPQAERAYQTAMAHWQKQWCCMKCGHVFTWLNGRA